MPCTDGRLGRHSFRGRGPLSLAARPGRSESRSRSCGRCVPGLLRGSLQLDSDPIDCARSLLPRADSLVFSTRTAIGSGNPRWHEVDGLSSGLDLPFVGGAVGFFGYELATVIAPTRALRESRRSWHFPISRSPSSIRSSPTTTRRSQLWMVGLGFAVGSLVERVSRRGTRRRGDLARSPIGFRLASRSSFHRASRLWCPAPDRERTTPAPQARLRSARPSCELTTAVGQARRRFASGFALESTVDASGYAKAVDAILEQIAAGNVYQANFSQRLTIPAAPADPWQLYQALRRHNPAPFGAYLALAGGGGALELARAVLCVSMRRGASRVGRSRARRPRGDDEVGDARLRARARHQREGPRREPDDRRSGAQRPRAVSARRGRSRCPS